jgi:MSHA biogenesis protein MshK
VTRRLLSLCLGSVGVLAAAWAWADVIVLPDPTRPPNAVLRAMSVRQAGGPAPMAAAPAAQPASTAASGASAPEPAKRMPRLTSVRLSADLGNLALLDGRMVRVGDRVGDSTVVSIDDDGVVLRGPKGLQRLSLTPTVSKRWPGKESPASGGGKETR